MSRLAHAAILIRHAVVTGLLSIVICSMRLVRFQRGCIPACVVSPHTPAAPMSTPSGKDGWIRRTHRTTSARRTNRSSWAEGV